MLVAWYHTPMADSKTLALVGAGTGFLLWLLWPKKAQAQTSSTPALPNPDRPNDKTVSQQSIMKMIRAEARRQGVPEAFALATAELESNFQNVKAKKGRSYGPMQVHVSALKDGEAEDRLLDLTFSIPRGVSILKDRLKRAKGDTLLARIMYFCGPGWQKSCSEPALDNLKRRWAPAAIKWGIPTHYPGF